ncbi:MAG TPA: PEP-CTERM sorting domain-containing protein [Verrucomicrobiae bacterium]|nr:PEP-CTERM sorting domain-containing protein [Verrucomicrobiae bacterium]
MNGKTAVKVAAVITAAVLSVSSAYSMSVNWAAATVVGIAMSDGVTPAPTGTLLELGYFTVSDATISALTPATGLTTAEADFSVWATGAVGDGGAADGEFTDALGAPGAGYFSKQAYALVIDGSYWAAIKGTSVAGANGDAWIFPASDGANPPTFEFGDLTAANVLVGGYNSAGTFNGSDQIIVGGNAVELLGVPEPSSIALVVMGLLGGIGLIRRRR